MRAPHKAIIGFVEPLPTRGPTGSKTRSLTRCKRWEDAAMDLGLGIHVKWLKWPR